MSCVSCKVLCLSLDIGIQRGHWCGGHFSQACSVCSLQSPLSGMDRYYDGAMENYTLPSAGKPHTHHKTGWSKWKYETDSGNADDVYEYINDQRSSPNGFQRPFSVDMSYLYWPCVKYRQYCVCHMRSIRNIAWPCSPTAESCTTGTVNRASFCSTQFIWCIARLPFMFL